MAQAGILLHACCAACAYVAIAELRGQSELPISLFFYGPNIESEAEVRQRQHDLVDLVARLGCDLITPEWQPEEYRSAVQPLEQPQSVQFDPDTPRRARKRCRRCYRLQLAGTAQAAVSGGFVAFSTTLLVSPYQDRAEVLAAGAEAGQANGLPFLSYDGRKRAFLGKQRARTFGYHLPDHSACTYSQARAEAPRLH